MPMTHMEVVKILPVIFKAAKTIYDISKQVKANKNQCARKCHVLGLLTDRFGLVTRLERASSTCRVRARGKFSGLLQFSSDGKSVAKSG